jgi:hypothetical protein
MDVEPAGTSARDALLAEARVNSRVADHNKASELPSKDVNPGLGRFAQRAD